MKLQERFEADKLELSYADLHHEITKSEARPDSKPPNSNARKKGVKGDEPVKYMLDLPSYLEKGKSANNKERAFHVGVLDWGRLEKWQQHSNKQPIIMHHRTSRHSTSSSSACSPFSTEGSSSHSSRGRSCSPVKHPTVHPRQVEPTKKRNDTTATATCSKDKTEIQECNTRVVQEKVVLLQPPTVHQSLHIRQEEPSKKRDDTTASCSKDKAEIQECNKRVQEKVVLLQPPTIHQPPPLRQEEPSKKRDNATTSCSRDKAEIKECNTRVVQEKVVILQPPTVNHPPHLAQVEPSKNRDNATATTSCSKDKADIQECNKRVVQEKVVLLQPDGNTKPRSTGVKSFPIIPRSCQLPRNSNTLPRQASPARAAISPSRDRMQETKSSNVQPKNIEKARSTSPFRHLGRIVKSYSSKEKSDSIPGPSNGSDKVKSRSSPLRRLLDPILKPKTDEPCKKKNSVSGDEDQRLSREVQLNSPAKVKLDPTAGSSSTVQALLRVAYKNGLPLFTFAVESDGDILAATVKNCSSSSEKGSIYTFFTIRETKKKSSSSWMSHGGRSRQDYVPNAVAQMNVSDTCSSDVWLREFVMFSVDTRRPSLPVLDLDYHQSDELAAIVTQLEPNKTSTKDRDGDSVYKTTVILPCGVHSLPSKGEPYSLVQRWKSGGSCDCGGWDPGCRYEILSGHHNSSLRSSSAMDQFALFHQGDTQEKQPPFVLAPFKDGIYSVEFDPSIKVLQAFSTCIAVLDSRKMMESSEGGGGGLSEPKTSSEATHIHNVSNPPFSPVGRV